MNLRPELEILAKKYNTTIEVIALAWAMAVPVQPTVVLGSTNSDRVLDSLKVFDVKLTREEWFSLLQVARGKEIA